MKKDWLHHHDHHHAQAAPWRSLALGFPLALAAGGICLWLLDAPPHWHSPRLIVAGVMAMTLANFAAMIALDEQRRELSALTYPALLAQTGFTLLCVIAEAINRFAIETGHGWLIAAAMPAMGLCTLACLTERRVVLKLLLAASAVAVGLLWSLAARDKLALPF